MPSFDGGDDFVGVGGPCEGLGLDVVFVEELVNGGLEISDESKDAAL